MKVKLKEGFFYVTNRKDRLLDKQKLKIIYYYSKMILESSEKLSLTRRSEVGEETTLILFCQVVDVFRRTTFSKH